MKKLSLGISVVLILALVLSIFPVVTVSAEDIYDLGPFASDNGLKGWCTNGYDGIATELTVDDIKAAKGLVITLDTSPSTSLTFVLQSDADPGWWDQTSVSCVDGVIAVDLTAMNTWADFLENGTQANLLIGDWGDFWDNNNVVSAVLTSDVPDIPAAEAAPIPDQPDSLVIGGGITLIDGVWFDDGAFYEYTIDSVADRPWVADASYTFRPEYQDGGTGPQTEDATILGVNVGAICYTEANEWVQYTVNVTKAGKYAVGGWASSGGDGGIVELYCNDALIGSFDVANKGWTNYSLYSAGIVDLEEGTYVIKALWPNGSMNFAGAVFAEVATNPYAALFIAGGNNTIKAVEFDNDAYSEFSAELAEAGNWSWYFDARDSFGNYALRQEYQENQDGPQTEAADVAGIGEIGAICYTHGPDDDHPEGEWVQYTVNVVKGGKYALGVWAATDTGKGKTIDIFWDGDLKGSPEILSKGWPNYNLHDVAIFDLTEGVHTLKLAWPVGDANVAAFVFLEGEDYPQPPPPPKDDNPGAGDGGNIGGGDDGASDGGSTAGAGGGGGGATNPANGDATILFTMILVALLGTAVVTVRKVRAR